MIPQSLQKDEWEQALLGAVLFREKIEDGCSLLTPEHFWGERARAVWGAILKLHSEGEQITPLMVLGLLDEKLRRRYPAILSWMLNLTGAYPDEYVLHRGPGELLERRARMGLYTTLEGARKEMKDPTVALPDLLDRALEAIQRIKLEAPCGECPSLEFEELEGVRDSYRGQELEGIPTGYPWLNEVTGGLRDIATIAGPPGVAKSTFALNIALEVCKGGAPVVYIDNENPKRHTLTKILCNVCNTTIERMRHAEFDFSLQNRHDLRPILCNLHLFDQGVTLTPTLLRKTIRSLNGRKPLVIIDSLHKLKPTEDSARLDRRNQVDAWLLELVTIKNVEEAPFLLVSELIKRDPGKGANLEDLKETGEIGYTSKVVMGLTLGGKRLDVKILKNNYGKAGEVGHFAFDPVHWRITKSEEQGELLDRGEGEGYPGY